jgi:hypothetical protein
MTQRLVVKDLQEAQADLASLKQASQAGEAPILATQVQMEEAAQLLPSFLQVFFCQSFLRIV